MEKTCTKCHCLKDMLAFPVRTRSKDGRASWCRACYKSNWDERYREHHQHYRNSHNASRNRQREQNALLVFEYLLQHPCVGCGESDPIVLEFDHRVETEKHGSISNLIRDTTWERVKAEIEKCDVRCANCHRRKSAAQFQYKRHVFISA